MKRIINFLNSKATAKGASIMIVVGIIVAGLGYFAITSESKYESPTVKSVQIEKTQPITEKESKKEVKEVKGQQTTQPPTKINSQPSTTDNSTYTYEADYSYLIDDLKQKKSFMLTTRGKSWYQSERDLLDSIHQNKMSMISNTYQDKKVTCYSYGSSSAYEACMYYLEQEIINAKQYEINRYNKELAILNSEWDSYKTWPLIIDELIQLIKEGNAPDSGFWDLYYDIPYI